MISIECRGSGLFVYSTGAGNDTSLWLINEGRREYIEAPHWANIGIVVVVMLIFFYNVVMASGRNLYALNKGKISPAGRNDTVCL